MTTTTTTTLARAIILGTIDYLLPSLEVYPPESVQRALDAISADLTRNGIPVPAAGLSPRLWLIQVRHTLQDMQP